VQAADMGRSNALSHALVRIKIKKILRNSRRVKTLTPEVSAEGANEGGSGRAKSKPRRM